MQLNPKDIDELYFNNPDSLIVNDVGLIHVTELDATTRYGLAFKISHMETGIEYRQMFLLTPSIFKDLLFLLQEHYEYDPPDSESI